MLKYTVSLCARKVLATLPEQILFGTQVCAMMSMVRLYGFYFPPTWPVLSTNPEAQGSLAFVLQAGTSVGLTDQSASGSVRQVTCVAHGSHPCHQGVLFHHPWQL
jgi:hypothetical protein